ncbi:MAG: hypothetical protein JST22_21175, partial [Bacteroidetes bacterium]|nr:hypothetical protein [Bacteroidota bacterium]
MYDLSDRKMDPESGRFVSPDRLWEKFPNVSPYSYCRNNPVRLTDQTGEQREEDEFGLSLPSNRVMQTPQRHRVRPQSRQRRVMAG